MGIRRKGAYCPFLRAHVHLNVSCEKILLFCASVLSSHIVYRAKRAERTRPSEWNLTFGCDVQEVLIGNER